MKKAAAIIASIIIALLVSANAGYAAWVWSSDTKRWENPKYAVRDTPKAQFELGMSYFNGSNYKAALSEFKKLIKSYPNSEFASQAQYFIGLCYQKTEDYYQAFLAYQKVIEVYPYNEKADQIIEEQFNMAKLFYDGYKSKLLGFAIVPSIDKAIEIFSKVVENAPYGKNADSAQYYLGLSYKKMQQYQEAQDAFKKLIDEYPQSQLVEDAKYQIGQCYADAAPKPAYDQLSTEASIREFKELVQTSPQSDKAKQAQGLLDELKEKKAQSVFDTAKFYERLKKYKSAQIYYKQILNEYPKTSWAAKSLERLEVLDNKGKT